MRRLLPVVLRAVTALSAVLLVLCAGVVGADVTSAVPPSGAVVLGSDLGIYVVNLDGTGLTRLTRGSHDGEPVWSPDGKWVAFDRLESLEFSVIVMRADGGGKRVLGSGVGPVWSPDSDRVAFADYSSGFTVVKPDGTGQRRFRVGEVSGLSWSPDSTEIAFTPHKDGAVPVSITSLGSGATRKLAVVRGVVGNVAWSPDGADIAIGFSNGIKLVDARSGAVKTLTGNRWDPPDWHAGTPVWSPDAAKLAFLRSGRLGRNRLFTIGRDGGNAHPVLSTACGFSVDAAPPAWTGDSSTLIVARQRSRPGVRHLAHRSRRTWRERAHARVPDRRRVHLPELGRDHDPGSTRP
jgi:Tol biopolymer transport system component